MRITYQPIRWDKCNTYVMFSGLIITKRKEWLNSLEKYVNNYFLKTKLENIKGKGVMNMYYLIEEKKI